MYPSIPTSYLTALDKTLNAKLNEWREWHPCLGSDFKPNALISSSFSIYNVGHQFVVIAFIILVDVPFTPSFFTAFIMKKC